MAFVRKAKCGWGWKLAACFPRYSRASVMLMGSIGVLLFLPSISVKAKDTCGGHDPNAPAKELVDTVTDPNSNKIVKVYCVQDVYFKAEIQCGENGVPTCFTKCVFDHGNNVDFGIPGVGGWSKYVWYNWDRDTCNVTLDDTAKKRGETEQQRADRIKMLLMNQNCDFNCYMWTRPPLPATTILPRGRDGKAGHSIELEGPGGTGVESLFEVFQNGNLVQSFVIPFEESEEAFSGGNPFLNLDPDMLGPNPQGQERDNTHVGFVDDFEDGFIEPRYATLPGTPPLSILDGDLKVNILNSGQGMNIDVLDLNPMCLMMSDLTLGPFPPGYGIGIEMKLESNDAFEIQMYQENSVKVKAVEKHADGTTTEIVRTVDGLNVGDIKSIQIDWVKSPGLLDRIQIEIVTTNGTKINKEFRSGLTHDSTRTSAYKITGIDISTDPFVCIGSIGYSDIHSDFVEGFIGELEVDSVVATGPAGTVTIGSTNTIAATARNLLGEGIPERELIFMVRNDLSTGGIEFTNPFGWHTEDRQEISLMTNFGGSTAGQFFATAEGTVVVEVMDEKMNDVATITFDVQAAVGPTVPAVSEWGLIIMVLLTLVIGKVAFTRKPGESRGPVLS